MRITQKAKLQKKQTKNKSYILWFWQIDLNDQRNMDAFNKKDYPKNGTHLDVYLFLANSVQLSSVPNKKESYLFVKLLSQQFLIKQIISGTCQIIIIDNILI